MQKQTARETSDTTTTQVSEVVPNSADGFAKVVLSKAAKAEPEVTSMLTNLSNSVGGRLEGLEFVLKSEASLSRKIATVSEKNSLPLSATAGDINDALRYTMILDQKSFGNNISAVIKEMESAGYKKRWVTKTFLDESAVYKGINTTFETKCGQMFELQFHTKDSFNVKQNINHVLYEEARLLTTPPQRLQQLNQQMILYSSKIPQPQGIDLIPNYWPRN
jgi:hypothetical protein